MQDKGEIRVASGRTERPTPRWAVPALTLAALLLVGAFMTLGSFEPPEVATEDLSFPDVIENAQNVVGDFAVAWNEHDPEGVLGLMDEEWESVSLPGFTNPRITADEGNARLRDVIGFLNSVARISIGSCTADISPPDAGTDAEIICSESEFRGPYFEAIAHNTWGDVPNSFAETAAAEAGPATIRFGVRRGRVVSLESSTAPYTPQAYCIWAEQARPDLAPELFDLDCRPRATVATGPIHDELAGAYLAAGSPIPSWQAARARLVAAYVDRFAELHNAGDITTAARWLSPAIDSVNLPGFAGSLGDAPDVKDYLRWSTRLLRIGIGECAVAVGTEGFTTVTCPDLTVDGPLLEEPLKQPTRFTINNVWRRGSLVRATDRIVAVEPLHDTFLPVEDTCRALRAVRSEAALRAFTEDCEPIYTIEGAAALAGVVQESQ